MKVFKIPKNRKTTNCLYKILGNTCDGVHFCYIYTKTLTFLMVFFTYLANILQHSSLNGCFHEDSGNKTANVFSLIFAGFYCSYS